MAYALLGLALAGHGGAGPGQSARLHGAADQALADLGNALEPLEARLAGLDRQRLRAAMGTGAFDAEYTAGRTLGLAQVLAALPERQAEPAGALVSEPDAAGTGTVCVWIADTEAVDKPRRFGVPRSAGARNRITVCNQR